MAGFWNVELFEFYSPLSGQQHAFHLHCEATPFRSGL
jgi:hypothetical protein